MMNTFQCLVLVAAIGLIITADTVSATNDCYKEKDCQGNKTAVSDFCCKLAGVKSYNVVDPIPFCFNCK
uniref:Uncharacterized protein n=1 Tax=Amphimedon queenslandica TaxID=400682 RepID=A0A1X7TL73_AMPQE